MYIFKYDKKIDTSCWKRVIKAGKLFGHSFLDSFYIDQSKIQIAKDRMKVYQQVWEPRHGAILEGIKKIYKHPCPKKIRIYINTSPYSMDGYPKKHISITFKAKTHRRILTSISHELSHFVFKKYYTDFCRKIGCGKGEMEEIKEILTVIKNIEFRGKLHKGWPIHSNLRRWAKKQWRKNRNLKSLIRGMHALLDKRS